LITLVVNDNHKLTELSCYDCQLTTLELKNNPNLKILVCWYNKSLDFDLEHLPENLERFDCEGTKLAEKLEVYFGRSDDVNYLNLL